MLGKYHTRRASCRAEPDAQESQGCGDPERREKMVNFKVLLLNPGRRTLGVDEVDTEKKKMLVLEPVGGHQCGGRSRQQNNSQVDLSVDLEQLKLIFIQAVEMTR